MKSFVFKIWIVLIMSSCSGSGRLLTQVEDPILSRIQYAQNDADYVKIEVVKEVLPTYNMYNHKDTLVLYTAVTRFYVDHRKPISYLRLCYLSNPYQFYQTKLEKGSGKYSIGKVDRLAKSIELLRNNSSYKTVSEIHNTVME